MPRIDIDAWTARQREQKRSLRTALKSVLNYTELHLADVERELNAMEGPSPAPPVQAPPRENSDFVGELAALLNRHSKENDSDTPDFVLANHLLQCLEAWNRSVGARERWWERGQKEQVLGTKADSPPPPDRRGMTVALDLNPRQRELVERLVEGGLHGSTGTEVILRMLDDTLQIIQIER